MLYLVQSDFSGTPVGVWDEDENSFYPEASTLEKSAQAIIQSRFEGEPWEEFADRVSDRISHRDWWETHESSRANLEDVWAEIVPSSESL